MPQCLLKCEDISLTIPIYRNRRILTSNPMQLFSGLYGGKGSRVKKSLLRNISFELNVGDSIGVLGSNGAGKTTLLRLLSGIYKPSSGSLTINGTSYGLFNVHIGMKPEASGVENIYLRGLQMGMGFPAIKQVQDEVIDFAGIGDAIYDPIRSYSNGMRMRLALAISTMINPDILLLDEWIGAGDHEFRKKINDRMMGLVDNSKGMIIATHNRVLMEKLCNKGLVIENGVIEFYGDIEDAIKYRLNQIRLKAS